MQLKYDITLRISTGSSRKELSWKLVELPYSGLLTRLGTTTRTPETYAEYMKCSKDHQDEIKDVGGFVGGVLRGGRRKGDAVVERGVVTLDVDFATPGFWEDLKLLQTFAVAVYSTHKHTPEKPRLRLVIPLRRPATPDEYKAVSRRIAADFGIDCFDDTTYDPARLMYWPSTAQDAEYLFDHVDAPILDPDVVLATYADWHDAAQWPESSRAQKTRQKTAEKQGDPTSKPGLVGAFCRVYDVPAAIDAFLPEIYTPTTDGRYTFVGGSTSGGLIVYDDGRFAYSHHGTDPAGDRLLNAFDLVRIHRFGQLDSDVAFGTPVNRLPSNAAMLELVGKDAAVLEAIGQERLQAAVAEFGELPVDPEADTKWMSRLEHSKSGQINPTRNNLVLILEHDPRLAGCFGYNQFTLRPTVIRPMPWNRTIGAPWQDADDSALRCYIETIYRINARDKLDDALATVMVKHRFHPVREYLDGLEWDGEPRIDRLLVDVMGAADTDYVRAVTRKWLTAAAARVRAPGCKFDYMPVLKGPQGVGKSRLLALLGRQDLGWFSDTPVPFDDAKAATETTAGKWIVELGELSGLRKAEVESVKRFISSQGDTVRQAFKRYPGTYLRQCVFAGTTNRDDYISDPTGNRRFWPIDVDPTNARYRREEYLTPATVDQIWAEADASFRRGELLYLPDALEVVATERQLEHTLMDERGAQVKEYLDRRLPADWYQLTLQDRIIWLSHDEDSTEAKNAGVLRRERVCAMEIWVECFGRRTSELERRHSQGITDIMLQLKDWYRAEGAQRIPGFGVSKVFLRRVTL